MWDTSGSPQGPITPVRVDHWVANQPPDAWQRLSIWGGENGQLVAEYLLARVWIWNGTEAKVRCWNLVVRRKVGASVISDDCLSNAPAQCHGRDWREYSQNATSSSSVYARPRANAVWQTIKCGDTKPGIITWPWSCWGPYVLNKQIIEGRKQCRCCRSTTWSPPSSTCYAVAN